MKELHRAGLRAVRGHLGMDPQRRRARDHRQREGQFRLSADGADPPGQRPVLAMAPGHRAVAVRAGVRESSARPAGSRGPEHRPPAAAGRGRTARRPATAKSVLRQENVPHLFGIRGILEKQHHVMRSALPRIALLALIWGSRSCGSCSQTAGSHPSRSFWPGSP